MKQDKDKFVTNYQHYQAQKISKMNQSSSYSVPNLKNAQRQYSPTENLILSTNDTQFMQLRNQKHNNKKTYEAINTGSTDNRSMFQAPRLPAISSLTPIMKNKLQIGDQFNFDNEDNYSMTLSYGDCKRINDLYNEIYNKNIIQMQVLQKQERGRHETFDQISSYSQLKPHMSQTDLKKGTRKISPIYSKDEQQVNKLDQMSEANKSNFYLDSRSELQNSIPHNKLHSMVNMAKQQMSHLNIQRWGLFARKLLIKDNKDCVFAMLNLNTAEIKQAIKKQINKPTAMDNWVRLMRAYIKVKIVNLADLKVSSIKEKLLSKKEKDKKLQINMRWGRLVRKYLEKYDQKITAKWKRLLQGLQRNHPKSFTFRSFYELNVETVSRLIKQEQANIKKQSLINLGNWRKLFKKIKTVQMKKAKLHKLIIIGKWYRLSSMLLEKNKVKTTPHKLKLRIKKSQYDGDFESLAQSSIENTRTQNSKAMERWVHLIKQLSFKKFGGFSVMVTDIKDFRRRISEMKANIRRINQNRLVLWGKWRIFYNKLMAKDRQKTETAAASQPIKPKTKEDKNKQFTKLKKDIQPKLTPIDRWAVIIKKLSFRKFGGFYVMVTEIRDIGSRIFAMKANIRRLKKRRLEIWGKWRIFYNKLMAKDRQKAETNAVITAKPIQAKIQEVKNKKSPNKQGNQPKLSPLDRWALFIKKLSFKKFGGFYILVTDIKDIGTRIFAMKANIRRLMKRRLEIWGKWRIFYNKLMAKDRQKEEQANLKQTEAKQNNVDVINKKKLESEEKASPSNNKALNNWANLIKKLSFRKFGGFNILVTDIKDLGTRIFAMKANIRRLNKRRLEIWGKWRIFYNKLMAKDRLREEQKTHKELVAKQQKVEQIRKLQDIDFENNKQTKQQSTDNSKALRNWSVLIKKLSFRKFGGFNILVTEIKDLGTRIFAMKANIRRLKKRRLEIWGKWRIFNNKLVAKQNQNEAKELKLKRLKVIGRWGRLKNKLLQKASEDDKNKKSGQVCLRFRRLINLKLSYERKQFKIKVMQRCMKWRQLAMKLLQKHNQQQSKQEMLLLN